MVIKSLAQTLKDLATGIKNTITGITSSNATLTIIKGNGTTSTVTVNNVANAGAATKATQDSAGQQINSTYIKGLSVSGQTITYTKGDGTTGTITTQDTTYAHPNSGVTAGTYKSVTVNAQGHVTAGSNPTTLAGYGITDASLKGHTHSQYLTASSDLNVNKLKGVISLDNLPAGALERLVKVTNDTARFALTTNDIQLGDTVKVESTKMMYIVKNITKLNSEDGYEQYTAGMASSVPWSGVTGKPSSYTPSVHTHDDRYYTESEINSKVNTINSSIDTKSDKTHTHDDRYYTESEIDSKLSTKSPLIGSTSLSKLSSNVTFGDGGAFSITQNDGSWWQRLRTNDNNDKTQKRLIYEESQGNSGSSYTELFSVDGNGNIYAGGTLLSKNGHTHDDRYYTESEIDSKLAGKQGSLTATGSATKGVYVDSSGTVKAMTYSVNKDVPSDAKFTDTVYTHPTTSGNKHIPSGGSSGQILRWSADGTAVWGADNNTTYSPATQSANGLMSAADKKKLDGIATGANAYTHPNSGVTAGTYRSVTVNAQGHVTGGSNPTTLAGYGITDAVKTSDVTSGQNPYGKIPKVGTDGVMEVGRYLDFHSTSNTNDNDVRLDVSGGVFNVTNGVIRQKGVNVSVSGHTHDDRYYTESEINAKLAGKSDTSHTHSYLPLAGGTTTGKVNMKSANLDNLPQVFRTDGVNFAGIRFQNTNGYLGAIGITGNVNNVVQRLGSDGNLYPILDSSNYNNYAPTKTGGGASGTWGINISGKANTAGTADTSKACSGNSATATKATQDSAGQQINTTYIKGLSVSGKTITYTKGNGTTGTITTQDTAYTHPNSGVTAGTYRNVTVNAQGHITGGSNPTTLAGYGITDGVFKYALGSTADKSVYTMFAGCPANAGSGNISATVLLTQGGNFGGAYQGAWLIQVSTRGGKYMSVKTLRSASSSPTFGYYVSGSTCYFGALFPAYRGDCNVTVLSNTSCTLKDFGDTTTAPSGWTAVIPELMLDSGNYNSYVPTKTGGGASGTWGINVSGNSATATKATQDSSGQQINTTYIKGLSVSGKTITYTKGNGTTGTITTQDTVYTLPAASSSTLGGIKMSYGTNDLSAGSSSLATGALYFVYE